MQRVKQQYGTALHKLLIFPGDWHTLKKFQPVLMKVYYSAGLRELAKSCGHRGATLKSIESCTHFKRTHCFLLQACKALYREMLKAYFNHNSDQSLLDVKCILSSGIHENRLPGKLMEQMEALLEDAETHPNFMKYIQQMAQADDTWKFWVQFVFSDCYSYIGLYLAITGSNWKLRLSSLKNMAPLFVAFDRDTYERIAPNHLTDLQQYPQQILSVFESGGSTVSLGGERWHSVTFDEAHEMCLNKYLKGAVVRPTKTYLQKTTLFSTSHQSIQE